MKEKHQCHCHHDHEHADRCCGGHHHDHCECGHEKDGEENDYSAVNAMFGLDQSVPEDAFSLLQTEMDECDELSEVLGLGDNPDVDDILQDAIEDLTPRKKKTLMNLAVILHDYLPEEN